MGARILYYLLLIPISYLPFWVLYLLSDLLYFVLYKIVGYRTKVVRKNISNSFPEKTTKEIKEIEAKFYSHLCDLIVESIKAFTISETEVKKRLVDDNTDLLNDIVSAGKHIVLAGGHYGNWEIFAVKIGIDLNHTPLALYTPLKNKFLNEKITKSRSKYGLQMLPIAGVKKKLTETSEKFTMIFGADQSPRKSQKAYWTTFLNQETGVQFGTEKFAKDFEAAVAFGICTKVKRGYYKIRYELICDDAASTDFGFISKTHTKMLENQILERPELWLWSHKRWKHKRPEAEKLN